MSVGALSRRRFLDLAAASAAGYAGLTSTTHAGQAAAVGQATPSTAPVPQAPLSALTAAALAAFVSGLRYDTIPPAAIDTAKAALLDGLGVTVAGASEEGARHCSALAREEGAAGDVTLLGQRWRTSPGQAAFVNGVASHAHDFDHSFVAGGQPTSPVVAASLAAAEAGRASGRQWLEGYVAGFEVAAAVMLAVQGAGGAAWHPNSTVGVFGATAACAKLLGLSSSQMETAFAIAASMAGGVQANFGTMTKPLHVGQAARHGYEAAVLARRGFTANVQVMEARNGYVASFYPGGAVDPTPVRDLGRVFALERYGARFKPYPCGGLTHAAIYAAIQLRTEHGIRTDRVESVRVDVPADTAAPLVYRVPRNGLEGKFSMPYLIARALTDGTIELDAFTDEAVKQPDVLRLLERVQMVVDPALRSGTDGSRPSTVTIRLTGGATHTLNQRFPKGSPQVPMSLEERQAKFRSCVRGVIREAAGERAMTVVAALETLPSVRTLTALLRGA
jgi:2-methylcitrate dehydratase PrpD